MPISNKLKKGKSQKLYLRAKKIISGGTQLLSKRPEMILPELWPSYYKKAKGCEVWDLDGHKYVDVSYMGIGANVLGYCDKDVDNAVIDCIRKGTNTTLNAPEEIELAELLLDLHPWADQVRHTKTGGEAMAVAVRIARAVTGKNKVLFCGYHGWHDWYLSSNIANDKSLDGHLIPGLEPKGVPRQLLGTSYPFEYNNIDDFLSKFNKYEDDIACIVVESVRNHLPNKDFFKVVRNTSKTKGIVLIIDEITAGFRLNLGGAHLEFGLEPDIAVFGKAMGNGYPISSIIGKKEVMEAAQSSFISSLFWTERSGFVAAIATIKKMKKINSPKIISEIGEKVKKGIKTNSISSSLQINMNGTPAICSFYFEHNNPLAIKTYLTQEMLKRGYLATTSFYTSCAHAGYIKNYLQHLKEVMDQISNLSGDIENYLEGPICHSGFRRLT